MYLKQAGSATLNAVAPYNFELTVHKPAGWWWSTPDEKYEKGALWTATRFNGALIGLKLRSGGTPRKPAVDCTFFSSRKLDDEEKQGLMRMLRRALRTDQNLAEFYTLAEKDDILRQTARNLCGMHTVAWPELFPALILAVTLQIAPMKRSGQMMDSLLRVFGEDANFDGKTVRYWPSTAKIAATPAQELQAKAKLGYRAANLVAIAKALEAGFPTMDELYALDPLEAKKVLMSLFGIGNYSADLVMPGLGFPLDVWSAKIFGILFRANIPENPRKAVPELKLDGERRWGRWAGLAFVYVLNDLPALSKHVGSDLTGF